MKKILRPLKNLFLLVLVYFWFTSGLLAQSNSEKSEFHNLFETKKEKIAEKWGVQKPQNEVQMLFSAFFVVYKDFLSSQDIARCNFHPSCSVYAIQSIQKNGVFIGLLSAFDRLMRCNGLNPEDYYFDKKTQLLHDPVL